ncbi:hypothetical protein [Paenisporosarcina sp.]|uniref:hypothetical protein n=1 Tax=Paenisporosarcina sp. TaxID=1932001 RepID=UPI003C746D09
MKASQDFIKQMEELHQTYEKEVTEKMKSGVLAEKTAKTYLRHSSTFIRWCQDDFVPGVMKENKRSN